MSFKKGCIPWNKDLTKETDERVMAISKKFRGRKIGGAIKHICWNKGLTKETDERLKAVGKKISKKLKGVPKGKKEKCPTYKPELHIIETRVCECPDHEEFQCEAGSKQRFISGHNGKGKTGEGTPMFGSHQSKTQRRRHSKLMKDKWQDLDYVEKMDRVHKSLVFRKKISLLQKGVKEKPETIEAGRQRTLAWWQDLEYREKQLETRNSPECFAKHSKAMKLVWQDLDWKEKTVKAIIEASHIKPNKDEVKLYNILQSNFSGEFAINVKANIMTLGGKIPDFVNINGQKKLIEYNSNYWHSKKRTGRTREQEELQRINYFKRYGWSTLIVWENELKNKEKLANRIKEFVKV